MEQAKPVQTEEATLKKIEEHLQSIRSMLKFFTFITVMAIALSFLNLLLGF